MFHAPLWKVYQGKQGCSRLWSISFLCPSPRLKLYCGFKATSCFWCLKSGVSAFNNLGKIYNWIKMIWFTYENCTNVFVVTLMFLWDISTNKCMNVWHCYNSKTPIYRKWDDGSFEMCVTPLSPHQSPFIGESFSIFWLTMWVFFPWQWWKPASKVLLGHIHKYALVYVTDNLTSVHIKRKKTHTSHL